MSMETPRPEDPLETGLRPLEYVTLNDYFYFLPQLLSIVLYIALGFTRPTPLTCWRI